MTRFGYVIVTVLIAELFTGLFVTVAILDPRPRVIWNASASVPIGLYRLHRSGKPRRGDLLAIAPPKPLANFLAARGYLPAGTPLLKHVAALPGERVCRLGDRVTVDRRLLGIAKINDRLGRPLPVWQGCRRLRDGELFLMNSTVPDSLDGRYFGPLPTSTVIGRAAPLWTDPPAHPASPPQPKES